MLKMVAKLSKVSGAVAVDEPFDLVLMDLQMPILDGRDAVQELRENGCDVPVIALTADAMKGTRDRLLGIGFTEDLSKPLDAKSLLITAAELLNRPMG